jgi:phospholipid/cholesterol/gamma-HCH transport system permease protein
MVTPLESPIARPLALGVSGIGRFGLLLWTAFGTASEARLVYRNLILQMREIGIASLPIAALAVAFTGGVTTLQSIYHMNSPLLPPSLVGTFVVPSLVMELGPLIVAFILTARVGARIAAELGTMRVSEQIDALEVMGLNSVRYLVAPRVLAGVLMFPVIYILVTALGILTSAVVAHMSGFLTLSLFIEGARVKFEAFQVIFGVIKSIAFGFIITSIACYKGYYTRGGAEGVGRGTTEAAVMACVFILFADYVAAAVLL